MASTLKPASVPLHLPSQGSSHAQSIPQRTCLIHGKHIEASICAVASSLTRQLPCPSNFSTPLASVVART
ncbi:hypothetical protein DUNSADRAFT_18327 [Dunaliella salina]|uniref:Encoded protein n=1 Tax=Dunaliella salina TaxID=3046 RepID=A0ABQ7GZ78_DUNSA|nr:hypothetical protein DUNSADRAFT_18327 [Dunaliella salina]|eukprot:KAF5839913.1 hypothetical protein DUNSADRAFT_18327 [Dunaliella salina]